MVDVFLHYYPHFVDKTPALAREFNESHPEYRVNIQSFNSWTMPWDIFRAVQEGRRPAIAQYFFTSTQLARDMLTKDGGPLFTSIGRVTAGRREILGEAVVHDDIVPAVRDYYSYDGELASVPTYASTIVLYTNTTLLAAAGVAELPGTWREIEAACAAVRGQRDGPPHGITWPSYGWMFQHAVAQQGGLLADRDNGRSGRAETVYIASDQMLAYVRWWQRLRQRGHYLYTNTEAIPDDRTKIWRDNFTAFAQQRVAFALSTSVDAERMVGAGRQGGFEVAVSRAPHNDEVPCEQGLIGGDSLWLADGLDETTRDGALAFIQYLNNARNAAERHKASHYIPITRAAAGLLESEGWFAERPHERVAVGLLSQARSAPPPGALLGNFTGIQDMLVQAMHDVLAEGAEPGRRFAEANACAQRLLDDYNAHCLGTAPGPRGPNSFDVR